MNDDKNGSGQAIKGFIKSGKVTKRLLRDIRPQQIAVLYHEDLDEVAAVGLIEADVAAVVNAKRTMTGKYPLNGPMLLLRAGVPIFEIAEESFDSLKDEGPVFIDGKFVSTTQERIPCRIFSMEEWQQLNKLAEQNVGRLLTEFIDNTITYAAKEKHMVTGHFPLPPLQTEMDGRDVLIVVRGSGYQNDLCALRPFIFKKNPILIGVDGGADAIINCGYLPDLIIGDMDSVSDGSLKSGAELVVHAYSDGTAPGFARVRSLGLHAELVPAPGTSEDIAMLIAFESGAERIVMVGTHSHMNDFLQKGRKGMASTLLTRMKIGERLIDAKGIGQLIINENQEIAGKYGMESLAGKISGSRRLLRRARNAAVVFGIVSMLAVGVVIGSTFRQFQANKDNPSKVNGWINNAQTIFREEPHEAFSIDRSTGAE